MKHEALLALIEDGIAKDICRQQIAGKLDPLKSECQRPGQRLRECCLSNAWDVFDQEMTAGEQTGDGEFYRLILAYDNFTNLFREGVNGVSHREIIYRKRAIRK